MADDSSRNSAHEVRQLVDVWASHIMSTIYIFRASIELPENTLMSSTKKSELYRSKRCRAMEEMCR